MDWLGPSKTKDEWCRHRHVSRSHWYRLKKLGKAPKTYGEGRSERISPEADAEWVRAQEAESNQESAA